LDAKLKSPAYTCGLIFLSDYHSFPYSLRGEDGRRVKKFKGRSWRKGVRLDPLGVTAQRKSPASAGYVNRI
jgi:hypothetical protein